MPTMRKDSPTNGILNGLATGDVDGNFKLGDFSIDEYRPIKVVAIGTGFSGIIAGIRYADRVSAVYECYKSA